MIKLKEISLYLSAFVPMYILILIRLVVDMINHNLSFNVLNSLNFATLILLIFFGSLGLYLNVFRSKDTSIEIVIINKENITDQHFLGYFSLFVLFALQLELSYVSDYILFLLILILIGIVYIKNSLFYINPLLNIMGYNFYNIVFHEKNSTEERHAKFFYKGELVIENKVYWVKLKNTNFSFIDSSKNNKNNK